jgi:hypothetical protein
MESPDLTSRPSPDDPIDKLLHAAPAPVPDDGFTARVTASLPPPRRGAPFRPLAAALGAFAGFVFAFAGWTPGAAVSADLARLAGACDEVTRQFSQPWGTVALGVIFFSVMFAWRTRRRAPFRL